MPNPTIELDIPDPKIEIIDRRTNMMTRQMVRFLTDIVRRLGGQRNDYVRTARTKALESEAMVNAILRGVTTGYYHTTATDLLSYTLREAQTF